MEQEQRISQRDILRRSPVALSDIIPLQKSAHPAGGFLSYRKAISYTTKNSLSIHSNQQAIFCHKSYIGRNLPMHTYRRKLI